jgi:iron(III) transport system substrate-binding protein
MERSAPAFIRPFGLVIFLWLASYGFAAVPSDSTPAKARGSEQRGSINPTSRDEIMAKAKTEGSLRVLAEMEPPHIKASAAGFMKKYPFIKLVIEEITGTDQAQRFILEMKAGRTKDWDVAHLSGDFRSEYLPHLLKIDILGMTERRVLQIPSEMVDPINRNVVAFQTRFSVFSYNQNLVAVSQTPKIWEDLLKPEFKGKKFAVDIRPQGITALVPSWGLEKTLDFSRKIAAQQPIWIRGGVKTLAAIQSGEIPMMIGPGMHTLKRAMLKDQTGLLQYVIPEPVPVQLSLQEAILNSSEHPHAALLFFEWLASPEAQRIGDELEPLGSSVYVRGSAVEQLLRGKKLSVVSWQDYQNFDQWQGKVLEAFGFPKAEKR